MDPRFRVISLANEGWASRCLHAAVHFNLADLVPADGISIDGLARQAGLQSHVLQAVMMILSGREIFALTENIVFHTPGSELLRTDHPATIADIVRWSGSDESWNGFGKLPETLRTGRSGFEHAFGMRMFDHLSAHEDVREVFRRSMEAFTRKQVESVLQAVDFGAFRTIVDVGGGNGLMARSIAENCPASAVTLFDLAGVAPQPQDDDRISIVTGNFFEDAIPSAELMVLMNVLHDWRDEEILKILASVRRSIDPAGRLFVIEGLFSPEKQSIALLDLGMAVMTGGRQRSRAEYEALLSSAGFSLRDELPCSEHLSILVAEPVA